MSRLNLMGVFIERSTCIVRDHLYNRETISLFHCTTGHPLNKILQKGHNLIATFCKI